VANTTKTNKKKAPEGAFSFSQQKGVRAEERGRTDTMATASLEKDLKTIVPTLYLWRFRGVCPLQTAFITLFAIDQRSFSPDKSIYTAALFPLFSTRNLGYRRCSSIENMSAVALSAQCITPHFK
jgi:hypothetical protein